MTFEQEKALIDREYPDYHPAREYDRKAWESACERADAATRKGRLIVRLLETYMTMEQVEQVLQDMWDAKYRKVQK